MLLNLKQIKIEVITLLVTPYDENNTKLYVRQRPILILLSNNKKWKVKIFRREA